MNRAPCYQRIAVEPPLPEHVTQNDDRRGAWPFVARGIEERSDGGHGTELAEQIGSHEMRLQRRSFRFNREPRAVPRMTAESVFECSRKKAISGYGNTDA